MRPLSPVPEKSTGKFFSDASTGVSSHSGSVGSSASTAWEKLSNNKHEGASGKGDDDPQPDGASVVARTNSYLRRKYQFEEGTYKKITVDKYHHRQVNGDQIVAEMS